MDLHAALSDHRIYLRRIEHLHEKHHLSGRMSTLEQDGVSLTSVRFNASKVSKLIAKTVASGTYEFRPAMLREITSQGKTRKVFTLCLTDAIVHGAVTDLVQKAMTPTLSASLYSYRKGVSWWTPSSLFASYVRDYRKSHPDPKSRGIYVLRRDIDSYTDSIPVNATSPLWDMIASLFIYGKDSRDSLQQTDWKLIEGVVRPQTRTQDGSMFSPVRGVPTGQPISCVLFNLYLRDLDHELSGIPGAFYARYCDDILFAHPNVDVVRDADRRLGELMSGLGLHFNQSKGQTLYLNDAGRSSAEYAEAKGTTSVEYVGLRVSATGTVSLSKKKMRGLLRDLQGRALRTASAVKNHDSDQRGRTVCSVINRALDPQHNLFHHRATSIVRKGVTDRQQLAQLDYRIARIVLRAVTGSDNVRAFREVPYRKLRREWGLISLFHARNKWGRR